MPDVFERYFEQFGKKVTDYYSLETTRSFLPCLLEDVTDIPADYDEFKKLFEELERAVSKA